MIEIGSSRFFNILPPEAPGGPFRLTAYFLNRYGKLIARIEENEWRSIGSNWDVEFTGTKITVREQKSDIALVIRADAPHGLIVERMNMWFQGMNLSIEDNGDFVIKGPMCAGGLQKRLCLHNVTIENVKVGLKMPHGGSSYWRNFSNEDQNYDWQLSGDGKGGLDFQHQPVTPGAVLRRKPYISSTELTPGATIFINEK